MNNIKPLTNLLPGSIITGAAYVRVSTDGQLDLSPESQLDEIKKYAQQNNILLLPEYIFMESDGVSGKKADNRIEFQHMIGTAKLEPKPFDVILVWKFSRFARNQDESTFYKGMLRKKLNIDVISVSEPILEGMYGRLIEMIIEWQDEFYSVNLGAEVIRGMKKNAQKGLYNGKVPYGYRKKPKEIPIVEESEANIIRMIFDMRDSGHDINYIVRHLNEAGIKTSSNKPFCTETVTYFLNNPFYIGQVRWNVRKSGSSRHHLNPKSEWIISQAPHEPIISLDQWGREQERRRHSLSIRSKYAHSVSHGTHWLSGMVKCSVCGKSLSFKKGYKGNTNSFQCLGYRSGLHSESQNISEKKLTAAVIQSLHQILKFCYNDFECIDLLDNERLCRQIEIFKNEIKKIEQKEERVLHAYMSGVDTLAEYKKHKQMLSVQKTEYEKQITGLSTSVGEQANTCAVFQGTVTTVLNIIESNADDNIKGNALRSIVKNIIFYKSAQTLELNYYLPESDSKFSLRT